MLDAYFERPTHAAASAALPMTREVSLSVSPEALGTFLWRIAPHIQESFGSPEIQKLIRVADLLETNDFWQTECNVTFQGRRYPIRIKLYRYSEQALAFYWEGSLCLSDIVQREIEALKRGV